MNIALFLLFLFIFVVSTTCAAQTSIDHQVVNMPELNSKTGQYEPHYIEMPKQPGVAILSWVGFGVWILGMIIVLVHN